MYIIKYVILGPRTKDNQTNYTGEQISKGKNFKTELFIRLLRTCENLPSYMCGYYIILYYNILIVSE